MKGSGVQEIGSEHGLVDGYDETMESDDEGSDFIDCGALFSQEMVETGKDFLLKGKGVLRHYFQFSYRVGGIIS